MADERAENRDAGNGESQATERDRVLADAQAKLDAQEREDEAGTERLEAREAKLLGGIYTVPDRAWRKHIARQEGSIPDEEAAMAAKVASGVEEAAYADRSRAQADAADVAARMPSTPLAAEAETILAEINEDCDDAMTEVIKTSAAASAAHEDARAGNAEAARQDADLAQSLLGKDAADLADADKALAKLESDMKAAGETPPQVS